MAVERGGFLKVMGYVANRKRVQRLMRQIGLSAIAPVPPLAARILSTRCIAICCAGYPSPGQNQVWSTDIPYIRLARGLAYLVAIIDGYSRKVLRGRISNSMEAVFCVDCLEDALRHHGKPAIFNSDQGSQFTSEAFTGALTRNGIAISMDGRG